MKKLTALLLSIVLLICSTMIGCKQEELPGDESTENGTESKTTQTQNVGLVEGILDDYDKEESQKGFTIKGKKYPYNDNDVLILEVENTTETHYSTTFIVTFYDKAGEIVKTQKKSLEQFPAEYKQACVFQPECQFDSYTCKLYVGEYTGVDYMSAFLGGKQILEAFIFVYEHMSPMLASVNVKIISRYESCTIIPDGKRLGFGIDVVIFDNKGQIYRIEQHIDENFLNTETEKSRSIVLIEPGNLDIQIPENLTEKLTVIVAPTDCYLRDAT